jgi:hypothetical protein
MSIIKYITSLLLLLLTFLHSAHASQIDVGALTEWNCPGPSTGGPQIDSSGDRLYLRIVDSAGNDLEVWCMQYGPWGRHRYEYWVSYRNGECTPSAQCGQNRLIA